MPTRHVQPHEGEPLQTIADMILRARKIVVVTGAGISTNSGIPDFRSENGLYSLIQAQFEAAAAREAAVQEAADSQLSPATPSSPVDNDEANGNERPNKRPRVSAGLPEDQQTSDRHDVSSTPPEPGSPAAAAASIFAPTAADPTRSTPPRHALFLDTCAANPSSPLSSPPPTTSAMTTPPSRPSPERSGLAAHLADPASFSTIAIPAAASSSPLSSPPPQALFDPGPTSMSRQSSACGSVTSSSIGTSTTPSEVSSSDGWAESSCPYMLSQASQAVKATLPNMKGRDLFDSQIWADPVRTSVFYTFTTTLRQRIRDARPTGTHYFISHLRDSGKLVRCYTQNIDRIEEKVGLSTSLAEGPGSRGRFSRRSLGAAGAGGAGRRGGGIKIEPTTTTATTATTADPGPGDDPKPQQDGSQTTKTTRESSVQPPPALSQSSTSITEPSMGPSDTTPATADPADDDPDPDRAKSRASRGVECVFLHGSLQSLRCFLCGRTSEWDANDREAATLRGRQPECPHCVGATTARLERGKRALGIGKLRPDIVLYGEEHPSGHLISSIVRHDLGLCPDLLLILGTSLRVHGLKVMVREFAKAVHERGQVVFVNFTRPSESLWGDVIDMWVEWDCDAWVADLRGRIPALWGRAAVAEVAAAKAASKAASKAAAKAAYKAAADAAAASKRLARIASKSLKAAGPGEREIAAPGRRGSGGGQKKRKTGPCQEVAAGEVGTRKKRTPLPMASGRNHSDKDGNGNSDGDGGGDDKEGGDPSAAAAPKPPEPTYVFTGAIRPQALREDHTNAAYLTQKIMQQLRRITRQPPWPRAPGLFTTMAVATAPAASAPSGSPREAEDRGGGDTVPKPGHRPKKLRKSVPAVVWLQKTGKKRSREQGAAAEPASITSQPEGSVPAPAMMIPAAKPATFGKPVWMASPAQRPILEQADESLDTSAAAISPLGPLTFEEPVPVASVHNIPSASLVQQQQEPVSISNPTRISTTLTPLLPAQTPIPGPTWISPPGKAPSLRPVSPPPLVLAPEPITPLSAGQLSSDSVHVQVTEPSASGHLLPDPGPISVVSTGPILPGDSGPAPAPAGLLLSDSGPVPVPADHLPPDLGPFPTPADHPLLPHWRPVPVPVGPVPAPWPPPRWSLLSPSPVWPCPPPEPERFAEPLATSSVTSCPTSTAVSGTQLGPGLEPALTFLAPASSPSPLPPLQPPQLGPGSRRPTPQPDEYNILAAVKANARIRKRRIIGGEEICLPVVRSRSRGRNTPTPLIASPRLLLPLPPSLPPAPACRSPSADLCEESIIANTLAPMLAWSGECPGAAPSAYPARPEPVEPTLQIEVTSPLAPKPSPRRENTTTRLIKMKPFAMLTDPLINYPRPPPAGSICRGISPGVDDWGGRAGPAGEEPQAGESPWAGGGPG